MSPAERKASHQSHPSFINYCTHFGASLQSNADICTISSSELKAYNTQIDQIWFEGSEIWSSNVEMIPKLSTWDTWKQKRKWQDFHTLTPKKKKEKKIISYTPFHWKGLKTNGVGGGTRMKEHTSNVTEERASLCLNVVLEFGTQAWIIHANELNWFKLKESPTNIIFFPLFPFRKLNPLNLQNNLIHNPS